MAAQQFSASALIPVPPQDLYAIIADYHQRHPRILPKPPFVSLIVEQGGTGAGTVMRVRMRVLGQVHSFRLAVTEPDPGRVLVETNDTRRLMRPTYVNELENLAALAGTRAG